MNLTGFDHRRSRFAAVFAMAAALIAQARGGIAETDYIPMGAAVMQIMNKQAGKTYSVLAPVGEKVKFGKVDIVVRKCLGVDEFRPEDYYAFVQVSKGDAGIFSGWMDRNEPGKNPLTDPDYDLWLVRCEQTEASAE